MSFVVTAQSVWIISTVTACLSGGGLLYYFKRGRTKPKQEIAMPEEPIQQSNKEELRELLMEAGLIDPSQMPLPPPPSPFNDEQQKTSVKQASSLKSVFQYSKGNGNGHTISNSSEAPMEQEENGFLERAIQNDITSKQLLINLAPVNKETEGAVQIKTLGKGYYKITLERATIIQNQNSRKVEEQLKKQQEETKEAGEKIAKDKTAKRKEQDQEEQEESAISIVDEAFKGTSLAKKGKGDQ